jgi:hypothetical protein
MNYSSSYRATTEYTHNDLSRRVERVEASLVHSWQPNHLHSLFNDHLKVTAATLRIGAAYAAKRVGTHGTSRVLSWGMLSLVVPLIDRGWMSPGWLSPGKEEHDRFTLRYPLFYMAYCGNVACVERALDMGRNPLADAEKVCAGP